MSIGSFVGASLKRSRKVFALFVGLALSLSSAAPALTATDGPRREAGDKRRSMRSRLFLRLAPLICAGTALLAVAGPAWAATFTVNQTGDESDASILDSVCDTDVLTLGDQCTLRAAIQQANNTLAADTINFSISGTGVKTINVGSSGNGALPSITQPVTIDGTTEADFSGSPLIELNGTSAGAGENGLRITAGSSTVKGLVINRFSGNGILLETLGGNTIEGNYIGTSAAGTAALPNGLNGVFVKGVSNNTVGGTTSAARNVISGNTGAGVAMQNSGASGATNNRVEGNYIGVTADNSASLGNGSDGVSVSGATSTDNAILSNSIHSQAGLGIDLGDDGVTPNDAGDPDTGPNNLQNFPVLNSAIRIAGTTTITGTLNSTPGTTFDIQFFSSPEKDPSGNGEGKSYLGQTNAVVTGLDGNALFEFTTLNAPAGAFVTATATRLDILTIPATPKGTSEFSNAVVVNTAPVANDQVVSTAEDTPQTITLTGTDADGDNLTYTITDPPDNGTLGTIGAVTCTGTAPKTCQADVTYTPNVDYNGPDSFKFRANDGNADSNEATVDITVTPVNDAPVIDLNGGQEGTEYSATFTEDGGPKLIVDGNALTVTDVDNATLTSATVTLTNRPDGNNAESLDANTSETTIVETYDSATGELKLTGVASTEDYQKVLRTVTYNNTSPNPNTTDRSVTFVVNDGTDNDGTDNSNTAVSTVTINAVNDAPTISDIPNQNANEDTDTGNIDFTVGDVETPAGNLVVTGGSSNTTLVPDSNITFGGSGANRTVKVTPLTNRSGTATITVSVSDGTDSTSDTFVLTVNPVNDTPTASATPSSLNIDGDASAQTITLSGSDIETAASNLTFTITEAPTHGTLKRSATVLGDGDTFTGSPTDVTYKPNADFNGSDSFGFKVTDRGDPDDCGAPSTSCDAAKDSSVVSVPITVTAVNDAPVANGDAYNTDEDTTLTVGPPGVLANDTDAENSSLTAERLTNPANGTLGFNADGSFTYTPNPNFNGTDSFTYRACEAGGGPCSDPATISITVTPDNDAPNAVDDTATTDEDTPVDINVLANDTDPDGDALTVDSFTQPNNGTVTRNANGTLKYTPNADFSGTDSFTYTVSDGNDGTDTATVTITVTPNDPPNAVDDTATTNEDNPVTVNVLANDTDPDGDSLTVTSNTQPSNGQVNCTNAGSCTYTPNADFHGTDSFQYTVSDGKGGTNTATVTVTVAAVNDPPVANDDAYNTDEDKPLTVPAPGVLGDDTDVEGDSLTAVLETGPQHGTLELRPDGSFTYTPSNNFNGTDSFTYRARDNSGALSNVATVTITVTPVNDPQVADLAITKEGPAQTTNGQPFDYRLVATNNGPNAAQNVVVEDDLPGGVTYNDGASTPSCEPIANTADPNDVRCTLASLAANQSQTFTINVTPTQTGQLSNTATVTSNTDDPNPANNADTETTTAKPAPKPNPSPACTIKGNDRDNVLRGTPADDVICGRGGDDSIEGRGGDDTIRGDSGNDVLRAGGGNDTVIGGSGRDTHRGEGGNDRLNARDGVGRNDTLNGGAGRDNCTADRGDPVSGCP